VKKPYEVWFPIPAPYLDEFRAASIHLAFAIVGLRAEPLPRILASGATPTSGGATTTLVSEELAATLYRVAESRGSSMRLDGRGNELAELSLLQRNESIDALVKSMKWEQISAYTFRT
jgi:hypothetical protein